MGGTRDLFELFFGREKGVLNKNNFTPLDEWKERMQQDRSGFVATAARWLYRGDIPDTLMELAEKFGGTLDRKKKMGDEFNFYRTLELELQGYLKRRNVIPLYLVIFEIIRDKYPIGDPWQWSDINLTNVLAILNSPNGVVRYLGEKNRQLYLEGKDRWAWDATARAYRDYMVKK